METLISIEWDLAKIITNRKKEWVLAYRLMAQVEEEQLWQLRHQSYRQWVIHLTKNQKINESYLWHLRRAGKFYSAYVDYCHQRGEDVIPLKALHIPVDTLNLIERISHGNQSEADRLLKKAFNNELSRKDLKEIWKSVKAEKAKLKEFQKSSEGDGSCASCKIKAKDIVQALNKPYWLVDIMDNKGDGATQEVIKEDLKRYVPQIYEYKCEFFFRTGIARYARHVDFIVLENYTVSAYDASYIANLHAIEIKLDKNALENNHKIPKHRYFADYFWMAVPYHLRTEAEEYLIDGWGLILVDDSQKARVHISARKQDECNLTDKYAALMTFVIGG